MKYGVPAGLGAAVLLVMGAAQSSTAYEIKPKQPNHERLTALAERCLAAAAGALPSHCPLPRTAAEFAATDIGGSVYADAVRWPDDPTRQISATGLGKIAVNLGAERCKKHVGPGKPFGGLMCNSHYGALQFLHAMRPVAGEAPSETRAKILGWTRAAFSIATGQGVDATTGYCAYFRSQSPALAEAFAPPGFPYCDDRTEGGKSYKAWRVHTLFTLECRNPVASTKCSELTGDAAAALARKRAAGALLHLIQDSFSQSHTARGGAFPAGPYSARVVCLPVREYYDYAQNSGVHPAADKAPTFDLAGCADGPVADPITASAQMLWLIEQRANPDAAVKLMAEAVLGAAT